MKRIKYFIFLIVAWCIGISNIERVGNLAEVHAAQVTVNDVKTKDDLENLLRGTGEFEGTALNTRREILKEILIKWFEGGSNTPQVNLVEQHILLNSPPEERDQSYFPQKELPCFDTKHMLTLDQAPGNLAQKLPNGERIHHQPRYANEVEEDIKKDPDEIAYECSESSLLFAETMLPGVLCLLQRLNPYENSVKEKIAPNANKKKKVMQIATAVAASYLAAICQENVIYSVVDNDCVCNDSSGEYRLRNLQTMMSTPQKIIDYLKHLKMCYDIYVEKCARNPKVLLKLFLGSKEERPNVNLDEEQLAYRDSVYYNFLNHIRKHWLDQERLKGGVDDNAYNSDISGFVCSPSYEGDLAQFAIDAFLDDSGVNMKMSLRTVGSLLYPAIKTESGENLFACAIQMPESDSSQAQTSDHFYVKIERTFASALAELVNNSKSELTHDIANEWKRNYPSVTIDPATKINQVQLFFNLCPSETSVNAQKCDFGSFYATQIAS